MKLPLAKRVFGLLLGISLVVVSCSKEGEPLDPQENQITEEEVLSNYSEPIEGQYIIVFREDGMKARTFSNERSVQTRTKMLLGDDRIKDVEILQVFSSAVSGAAVRLSPRDLEELKDHKDIAYIEQDRLIALAPPCGLRPNDPCPGDGDDGDDGDEGDDGDNGDDEDNGEPVQITPYGVARVNGVADYMGNNVAWILDSGIDLDHEDLNVDASIGFNAFTRGRDARSLDDYNGHGTHVAGTIAAKNNEFGVVGVAPGATVVPVKVLDSRGNGSYSGLIAALDHVAANGSPGDVANLSLGGPASQALDDAVLAVAANGIKIVLASGNEGMDANEVSPARVNGENVYTISAVDENDNWAPFSNFGNPPVDFAAPGVGIISTYRMGSYASASGTSMAAPHAAGVLLLGEASTDGVANNDPDGNADPIIVH